MRYLILLLTFCVSLTAVAQPKDYVWHSQSDNSAGSMPCGGSGVGLNVWVERGNLYFYIARSGCFDELNSLLKMGRIKIAMSEKFAAQGFTQTLKVNDGYVSVTDGKKTIDIWVDAYKPVVHVEMSSKTRVGIDVEYQSWRYRNRDISKKESFQTSYKFGVPKGTQTRADYVEAADYRLFFCHENTDSTVVDATAWQQQLGDVRDSIFNPLRNNVIGGSISAPGFHYIDIQRDSAYASTDYRAWWLAYERPTNWAYLTISLADTQQGRDALRTKLSDIEKTINTAADKKKTLRWWHDFWKRSYIEAEGRGSEMTRNYTLFRYMLGCNNISEGWPTKFNGGLFTFDPVYVDTTYAFTPDYRRWGGGTHTAQNQRLVYWPMLKSGDYDLLLPQLDFYNNILSIAKLRSRRYWNHGGANFNEQIENFGLPEYDEYGKKRPAYFDPGVEYNAWLEYTWDTVLEFCQMALDAHSYGGVDISRYEDLICSSVDFFDEHYRMLARQRGRKELDGNGKLVIYPGSACETFKMAYNPSSTVAGLRYVTQHLIDYQERTGADTTKTAHYRQLLTRIPDIPFRDVDGHRVIAPARLWERVNNTEAPMLYAVFPWRVYGVGRDSIDVALDTWRYDPYVNKFKGWAGWEQHNIWAACLGITDEAWELTNKKLTAAPHRFPAFWGPGHDWTPDHNWGGTAMIGLQEMLMQEVGDTIYLLPAWPKDIPVRFKLHAHDGVTVEVWYDGKEAKTKLLPEDCGKTIIIHRSETDK